MLEGFKEFAMRGNVLDMAIGVIIGASFGKIVASLVSDIIMPPLGLALGKIDFSNMYLSLAGPAYPTLAAAKAAGTLTLNYGMFLNTVLEFLIVAFALYVVISQINKLKRQAPPPAPNTKECPHCLSSIPLKATKCAHCTSKLDN